jgi:GAF domain-containing protein
LEFQLTDETEAQRWLSTIDQPSISLLARNLLSSSFRFRNMLNLAREISAPSLDPADILPHILDACSQILTAECWCLCLADPVSLAWLPVMEKTFPRPTNNAFAAMAAAITTYNMDDAWVQTVLQRTAQSARVFSWSRSTSAFDPTLFELNDEIPNQIRSVLCVPLMDADKVVVTLLLAVNKFHRNDAAWNEDKFYRGELATAEILALLSSNTLQHATMYENALISRRQAEVMLYLQRELNSESGTERVIQKIFESTVTLVNAQHVTLFLLDKKRDEFIARFFVALDNFSLQNDDQSNSRRISMSAAGMAGHILNSGRSVRVDCIGNDPRFNDTEHFVIDRPGISSKGLALIATPVLDQDGCCIAVIQATKSLDEGFGFSEDDESLLGSLSSAAGLALRSS